MLQKDFGGSLIFGGGQVLIPLMYNEFVEFKNYLSSEEFLTGYALVQALPGPVFAFCSYLGVFAMRHEGIWGQLLGSAVSSAGIFPTEKNRRKNSDGKHLEHVFVIQRYRFLLTKFLFVCLSLITFLIKEIRRIIIAEKVKL